MIADELRERLKVCLNYLITIQQSYANKELKKRYAFLNSSINKENSWQDPEQVILMKEMSRLKEQLDELNSVETAYAEAQDFLDLFGESEEDLKNLKLDIDHLESQLKALKIKLLLGGKYDENNCFLSINAGAGGTESQDWAEILLRMYVRFCERNGFKFSVLDYQSGEAAGMKSATLYIKKKNAYGFLRAESGVHRLVRISPFDANKRRHTSFAVVSVAPDIETEAIEINPNDLRIDTYRAGGAGGQHVNKTDSAVRITHLPTNIVVQCQNERSQPQNKQTAMKMLAAKLAEKQEDERLTKLALQEKKKIEWGSQIRSYVLHPYKMVKDHRTELESAQPDDVLDGDIMPFIEAFLIQQGPR